MKKAETARQYMRLRRYSAPLRYRFRARALTAVRLFQRYAAPVSRVKVLELEAADGETLLEVRRLLGGEGTFHGIEADKGYFSSGIRFPEDVKLLEGNAEALPEIVEPGSYDLCLALALLEHLSRPEACMREAFRVLRPGGLFIATVPRPLWDRIAGALKLVSGGAVWHKRRLSLEAMELLARRAGLAPLAANLFMWAPVGALPYFGIPVSPVWSRTIDSGVERVRFLRSAFVNQVIVAQKP